MISVLFSTCASGPLGCHVLIVLLSSYTVISAHILPSTIPSTFPSLSRPHGILTVPPSISIIVQPSPSQRLKITTTTPTHLRQANRHILAHDVPHRGRLLSHELLELLRLRAFLEYELVEFFFLRDEVVCVFLRLRMCQDVIVDSNRWCKGPWSQMSWI